MNTALTNSECGSVILAGGGAQWLVTMPASPPANCEFTFEIGATYGFYVYFNGKYAALPGYPDQITQWTIPISATFRTNNPAISLQFNGTNWEQSGFSSPIYQTTLQPLNAAQLAHGQVYFSWNSTSSQFQLCQSNGPGGLIVDSLLWEVPSACLTLAQSATMSSARNFFYAVHTGDDVDIPVSNVTDNGSGKIRITVSDVRGNAGDTIFVSCVNIAGAIQANVMDSATVSSNTTWDLQNTSSTGLGTYTSGTGLCSVLRLTASTTGHATYVNGVEIMSGDGHYTLVGIANIGSTNAVNDSLSKRDVASWFNRQAKKMLVPCNSTMTTTSASLRTPTTNTCEGEFVVFTGPQTSPPPAVQWFVNSGISNSTSTTAAGNVTACFGTSSLATNTSCGNTPEPETGTASLFSLSEVMPIAVSGMTTTLAEGVNYMDLIGDTSAGTMTYLSSGTNDDTTIGAILMQ